MKNSPSHIKVYIKATIRLRHHFLIQTIKMAFRTRWLSLGAGVKAVHKTRFVELKQF